MGHEVASLSGCLRLIRLQVWPPMLFFLYFLSPVIGYVLFRYVALRFDFPPSLLNRKLG